jgi:hypothetical protein
MEKSTRKKAAAAAPVVIISKKVPVKKLPGDKHKH